MLSYFERPYPYYYRDQKRLILGLLLLSLVSFIFSYMFEPFEVNPAEHRMDYFWICIIHAFTPFFICLLFFQFFNRLFKSEELWTLGKEMMLIISLLVLIGVGSFLVRDIIYTNPDNWSLHYFLEEIQNTVLVGTLVLFIVLPVNIELLIKKYQQSATSLKFSEHDKISDHEAIKLFASGLNETLECELHEFVYAKVEGNYTFIFLFQHEKFNKILIRSTLNDIEKQLLKFPKIFRTHRSYLINTAHIKAVKGNAQGYQITLDCCDQKLPVSRSRISKFNQLFDS